MPSSSETADSLVASDDPAQAYRHPLMPIQPPIRDTGPKTSHFKMVNVKVNGIMRSVMVPQDISPATKPISTTAVAGSLSVSASLPPPVSIISVSPPGAAQTTNSLLKPVTQVTSAGKFAQRVPGNMVSLLPSSSSGPQYILVPTTPPNQSQAQKQTIVFMPSPSLAQMPKIATSVVHNLAGRPSTSTDSKAENITSGLLLTNEKQALPLLSSGPIREGQQSNKRELKQPSTGTVQPSTDVSPSKRPCGDLVEHWSDDDDVPLINMVSPLSGSDKPENEAANKERSPTPGDSTDTAITIDDTPTGDKLPFPIPVPTSLESAIPNITNPNTCPWIPTSNRGSALITQLLTESPQKDSNQTTPSSLFVSSSHHRRKCKPVKCIGRHVGENWLDSATDSDLFDYLSTPGDLSTTDEDSPSISMKATKSDVAACPSAIDVTPSNDSDIVKIDENEFDSSMFRIDSIYSLADVSADSISHTSPPAVPKSASPSSGHTDVDSSPTTGTHIQSSAPAPATTQNHHQVEDESEPSSGIDGHIMFPNLSQKLARDKSGEVDTLSLLDEGREVLRGDYHQVRAAQEAVRQLQAARQAEGTFSAYPQGTNTYLLSQSQAKDQQKVAHSSSKHPYPKILSTFPSTHPRPSLISVAPGARYGSHSNVRFSTMSQLLKKNPPGKPVVTFQPRNVPVAARAHATPGIRQPVRMLAQPQQPGSPMVVYVMPNPKDPNSQIRYVAPSHLSKGQSLLQRPSLTSMTLPPTALSASRAGFHPGRNTSFRQTLIRPSGNYLPTGRPATSLPVRTLSGAPVQLRLPGPLSKIQGGSFGVRTDSPVIGRSTKRISTATTKAGSPDVILVDDEDPIKNDQSAASGVDDTTKKKKKKKKKIPRKAKHVNKWRRTHPSYFRCATLCVKLNLGKRKSVDVKTFSLPEIPAKVLKKYRPIRYRKSDEVSQSKDDSSKQKPPIVPTLNSGTTPALPWSTASRTIESSSGKSMQIMYINGKEYCFYTDAGKPSPQDVNTVSSARKVMLPNTSVASGMNLLKMDRKDVPIVMSVPAPSQNQLSVKSASPMSQGALPIISQNIGRAPTSIPASVPVSTNGSNVIWLGSAPNKAVPSRAKAVQSVIMTPSPVQPLSRATSQNTPTHKVPVTLTPVVPASPMFGQPRFICLKTPTGNVLVPVTNTPVSSPATSISIASPTTPKSITLKSPTVSHSLAPSSKQGVHKQHQMQFNINTKSSSSSSSSSSLSPAQSSLISALNSPPSLSSKSSPKKRRLSKKSPERSKAKAKAETKTCSEVKADSDVKSDVPKRSKVKVETKTHYEVKSDNDVKDDVSKIEPAQTPPSQGLRKRTRASPRFKRAVSTVEEASDASETKETVSPAESAHDLSSKSPEASPRSPRLRARRRASQPSGNNPSTASAEGASPAPVESEPPPLLTPAHIDSPSTSGWLDSPQLLNIKTEINIVDSPASQASSDEKIVVTVPNTSKKSRIEELKAQLREKQAKLESLRQERAENKKVTSVSSP